MMGRTRIIGVAAVLTTAAISGIGGASSAAPLDRGVFHDEFSELAKDFCESAGLNVQINGVVDGRFLVNARGRDNLVYFQEHVRVAVMYTNVDNGKFVTSNERTVSKDLKVINNEDGTLTIIALATGNATVFGADGKAIARNPGQVRFKFVVDHAGTPSDPSDDVLIEDLGLIKGSTGRSDDFCAAVVPALT
jgi:hypothetical protein